MSVSSQCPEEIVGAPRFLVPPRVSRGARLWVVLAEHQVQEPLALPSWSQVKPGAVFGDASARSLSSLGASVQALGLRLPLAGALWNRHLLLLF